MKFRGQIIFWACVIAIPISILTGDSESFFMAIGILALGLFMGFILNLFK